MKKNQIISGLLCVSALTGCQNLLPEISSKEKKEVARLVNQDQVECVVVNNVTTPNDPLLIGSFVLYQLQFDMNNNKRPDMELAVCADVSDLNQQELQAYIKQVKTMPETEEMSLKEWQRKVETNPILKGKVPETYFYRMEEKQHTR